MADPADIISLDNFINVTKRHVEVVISSESRILSAIAQWYGAGNARQQLIEEFAKDVAETGVEREPQYTEEKTDTRLEIEANEQPIVELINCCIVEAVLDHATDIHWEPSKDFMVVRFRIDGVLYKKHQLPRRQIAQVTSRMKLLSDLDISEKRNPQDGRISLMVMGQDIDIRVSTFPSRYGEKIVLRILDKSRNSFPLSELGLSAKDLDVLKNLIEATSGMILATGPTGSGKTTTIYSAINAMNKTEKNIMTIEDPIEYGIEGIIQSQVNPKAGVTFATALTSLLRQDPDIMYVGEIRDLETAKIVVQAALTGHLVVSTLHTNNAASTIVRLLELGIEPYLVSPTLLSVLAQRLMRRNCLLCIAEEEVEPTIRATLGVADDEVFYRGRGCEYCNGTGYRDRIAVYELLVMSAEMRTQIMARASADEIRDQAIKDGMVPLMDNALAQARQREISLAEVYRVRLE